MVKAVFLPSGREPLALNVTLSPWISQSSALPWPPVDSKARQTMRLLAVSQPMSQVDFQTGSESGRPIA